jgi:site-specific DNA-cytosine methylase
VRAIGILAGIGTLLREAQDAGMTVAGNVELRAPFRTVPDVWDMNFPMVPCLWREPEHDVGVTALEDVFMEADLALGHPPCGAHSILGVAHSLDKPAAERARLAARRAKRVGLLPNFVEMVNRFKPRSFALDNLPKILKTVASPEWWELLLPKYHLTYIVMENWTYGTPQRRERLWVVGVRKPGRPFRLREPRHRLPGPTTAWEAIHDLPLIYDVPSIGHVHQAGDDKPFGSYPTLDQPPQYVNTVAELAYRYLALPPMACWPYRTRTTNRVTKKLGRVRLRMDAKSRVISGGTLQHPITGWTLTPRERARLMDWPDDFHLWNGARAFDRAYQNRLTLFTGKAVPSAFPRYFIPQLLSHLRKS